MTKYLAFSILKLKKIECARRYFVIISNTIVQMV